MKYILDGYNLLHHPGFRRFMQSTPEDTAKAFIPYLKEEAGLNFVVVFDGRFDIPPDLIKFARLSGKQDADTYIVNMLLREGTENKVVVTNDVHLRMRVRNIGAKVISVEEFYMLIQKKRKHQRRGKGFSKDGIDKKTEDEINRLLKKEFGIE